MVVVAGNAMVVAPERGDDPETFREDEDGDDDAAGRGGNGMGR